MEGSSMGLSLRAHEFHDAVGSLSLGRLPFNFSAASPKPHTVKPHTVIP
jgi:hypothetical protein